MCVCVCVCVKQKISCKTANHFTSAIPLSTRLSESLRLKYSSTQLLSVCRDGSTDGSTELDVKQPSLSITRYDVTVLIVTLMSVSPAVYSKDRLTSWLLKTAQAVYQMSEPWVKLVVILMLAITVILSTVHRSHGSKEAMRIFLMSEQQLSERTS